MESNRGVALILALLVLSFLTILGSALVATATIDIWIGDNYRTAIQNLYLTEAGIDQAREFLQAPGNTPGQLLTGAAGPDGRLATAMDLATLLAGDDQPLIPADPALRWTGQPFADSSGRTIGHYYVWLRNDSVDGVAATTDTNDVLTLLGFGLVGSTRKVIEVTVRKGRFPDLPGTDTHTDPRLGTVAGLESLSSSISHNASDYYQSIGAEAIAIRNYGGPTNYKIVVVEGDAVIGPGTGYGILLVRGAMKVAGNFTWNGLILIIGRGELNWVSGARGTINGGLLIARTRAADGSTLARPGGVTADLSPATILYDPAAIRAANQAFPFNPIAINER
jgi:hypothetical protein